MALNVSEHDDVNAVLTRYHQHIKAILGDKFVGMYLYGSLTTGHFDWHQSDIDFLVVTTEEVRGDMLKRLQQMHIDLSSQSERWGLEIEASYIPKKALWQYDIHNRHHPHIDRGSNQLDIMQHDMDWVVQRYTLLDSGIVIEGDPLSELIAPISVETLRQTMLDLMDFWWVPQSNNPNFFDDQGHQYGQYTILSMCRMLYTAKEGKTIAKIPAGQWAIGEVDEDWHTLIQLALDYPGGTRDITLAEVQDFIRYMYKQLQNSL